MGSRIYFNLSDCLQHPDVSVQLEYLPIAEGESECQQIARVIFAPDNGPIQQFVFDADVSEGRVTLSGDFNFFRHRSECENELKFFYETSIPFEVIH